MMPRRGSARVVILMTRPSQAGPPMSDQSASNCILCHDLSPRQRRKMRASLIEVPLRDTDDICDPCLVAWWVNLLASRRRRDQGLG
jgi:hypothetical protein